MRAQNNKQEPLLSINIGEIAHHGKSSCAHMSGGARGFQPAGLPLSLTSHHNPIYFLKARLAASQPLQTSSSRPYIQLIIVKRSLSTGAPRYGLDMKPGAFPTAAISCSADPNLSGRIKQPPASGDRKSKGRSNTSRSREFKQCERWPHVISEVTFCL